MPRIRFDGPDAKKLSGLPERPESSLFAVRDLRRFKRENGLGHIETNVGQRLDNGDLLHRQERKQGQETFQIRVFHVDPVLVILIGRGELGIEPDRPFFGLSHLLTVRRRDQRERHAESRFSLYPPNQVNTGHHVPPLVISPHLQATTVILKKMQEIIGLQKHVVELDEIETLFQTDPVTLGGEHAVDAEVSSDIAKELDIIEPREPIGIIEHDGLPLVEIQISRELYLKAARIAIDLVVGENLPHLRLSRRISDQSGPSSDQGNRPVAVPLHMGQRHDRHQRADMQTRRRRIETDIAGDLLSTQEISELRSIADLLQESPLLEYLVNALQCSPSFKATLTLSIAAARPSGSISTVTPWRRTSPLATSNLLGI